MKSGISKALLETQPDKSAFPRQNSYCYNLMNKKIEKIINILHMILNRKNEVASPNLAIYSKILQIHLHSSHIKITNMSISICKL
jgi:hypothetical protein